MAWLASGSWEGRWNARLWSLHAVILLYRALVWGSVLISVALGMAAFF